MGMARRDFLKAIFQVLDHARQIQNVTHQPEDFCYQNGDIYERNRRGYFVIIDNNPGFASGH